MGQSFIGRQKRRATQHARRPEHQRCSETPAIGYSTRRDHGHVANRIDHRRNQGQSRARAAVASRFRSLRDDNVRALFDRDTGLRDRLDLRDQRKASLPDRSNETSELPK